MFDETDQIGVLYGSTQNQNLFAQTQNQTTGFFGSSNTNIINGTTLKYVPLNGTDNIQSVNITTKLNCISAMKEYEVKSLEELRFEDYMANRVNPQKPSASGIFGGNQTTPALFNNQMSMFPSNAPFGSTQQNTPGTAAQTPLFGSGSQINAFGSKNLFGHTPTPTNSAFGSFSNQSKPSTLFGTGTQNMPLFGSTQSTQSTSMFGGTQQQTGFFGSFQAQQQPSQSTGFFNTNTSTASFGFQSQPSTGLFGGNNAAKPFGPTNTNFSFSTSNTQSNPTLIGGAAPTGGLFSQNTTNQVFVSTAKPSLFSNFSTPVSSQSQNIFPQTNIFGSQPKTNQSPFGTTSPFDNAQKPSLFGTTTNIGFGGQSNSSFGNFGTNNQPFGSTVTTSIVAPFNNVPQIGITTPAEVFFQQQIVQQKILSLVSNRPYGINKLFMGQNFASGDETKVSGTGASVNANLLSLAIKRNEADSLAIPQRRGILNQKTKINPSHMSSACSGFDEDEYLSIKSNKVDNFMIKREDWKYLPPEAFKKSRRSLASNNSPINSNFIASDKHGNASQFMKETNRNYCSTPLSDNSFRQTKTFHSLSPIYNNNGRTSPIQNISTNKKESVVNNSNVENNEEYMKSKEVKMEFLTCGSIGKSCQIKLTKEGYCTLPTLKELNKLVTDNECWVENFSICRKGYGSITFFGFTNVFGLNIDEIVNIIQKEVSVYPNDDMKPEKGKGLNKPAQVILYEIFPVDKSSGNIIKESNRLKTMNFEEKLKKLTNKIGAKFISYTPENGEWIFEVEHFSRYGYFKSDDEEVGILEQITTKKVDLPKVDLKKETVLELVEKENISDIRVVSAESNSMSNIKGSQGLPKQRSALDKLSVNYSSRNAYKLKQSFYNYESDEEIGDSKLFRTSSMIQKNTTVINKFEQKEIEKYQPVPKKFETSEMGGRIFNSRNDCLTISLNFNSGKQFIDIDEENDKRRIKPLKAEHIASTIPVESNSNSLQRFYIPSHLRDLNSLKMPYLFEEFFNYFDSDSKCPLWSPSDGLNVLKCYLNTHNKMKTISSTEKSIFGRIIELCNALWNNLGDEQDCLPWPIQDIYRKQISKWIRTECGEKLMKEVEAVMNSSMINIDKCNTVILNALCSWKISLACQLTISTKRHRLSLLIAQAASNLQGREMVKEQLNQWLKSLTDIHLPHNILCIYLLLSGQTSVELSDGSFLTPFKHMNWVQEFGSHLWYTQSYLGSIKSATELYDNVFKTELDIPSPFPVGIEQDSLCENDDKYYDCCYHLIKLYCDRLYNLDVLLNPPTISRANSHKLSWDWSASWHLANILTSLGFSKNISSKISTEWAAQLERGGMWKMVAFVILYVPELRIRTNLLKTLINRHVKESNGLSDDEQFLVGMQATICFNFQ